MSEVEERPATRRWRQLLFLSAALVVAVLTGVSIYIHSDSFQSLVRRRLVEELERVSGGRAEIESIHTTPFRLQADVRGITIHGKEPAGEVALAHVDRIVGRLKISSLLRSELAFHEVLLEKPVIHVAFYPDGTSNVPGRQGASFDPGKNVEELFSLSVDHFELRDGQILWDQENIPLDFDARAIALQMNYSLLHRRYDGKLSVGTVETKLTECRPFAWTTSVEFSLTTNSAILPSVKWNSQHSHFSASGQISHFRDPRFVGQYEGQFDLGDAASIARFRSLQSGSLEVKGRGEWQGGRFSTDGSLTAHDLAWSDEQASVSRVSLSTGYLATDRQIKLSRIEGKLLGGSFAGDGEWDDWQTPAQHVSTAGRRALETATISAASPAKKGQQIVPPQRSAVQSAFLTVRFRDLPADSMATALDRPAHPVPRIHPAAAAAGTLEARWKGTPADMEFKVGFDLVASAHPDPGQTPINAHGEGTYYLADSSLDAPQFILSTPTSRVQVSGKLSQASALRLIVSTSSVADWLPFLAMVRGPEQFPITLNGKATFSGGMTGSLSSPQLAGNVEVDDFDLNFPATKRTKALQTNWDSLTGSIQASFQGFAVRNGRLERGDTNSTFDGSAVLDHGHFTADSSFTLRASIANADVASLNTVAGYDYPLTGRADVEVQAGGTFGDPHGSGRIHVTGASAYGQDVRLFDSDFRLAEGEIALSHIHLLHGDAVVTGSAAYNPAAKTFRLDVAGNDFDLAKIQALQPDDLTVEGLADFVIQASGNFNAPSINAAVRTHNLVIDQESTGELDVQAVSAGDRLQISGNSHFERGSLQIGGEVGLDDGYPANLTFKTDGLDLDALWRAYFNQKLTGHTAVTASLQMHGPLRQPANWTIGGTIAALSLDVEHVKLQQREPILFSIANGSLNVEHMHLFGEGTDMTAHGAVGLVAPYKLDFSTSGNVDLKLLSAFDSNLAAAGLVKVDMTVSGTYAEPMPQGRLLLADGSVAYEGLPSGLTELNGSLLFSRDHLHIDKLAARTGGGVVDLKGDATYFNHQLSFDLTGTAKDVRLRYPPGVSSTADAQLRWVGTRAGSTVSGDVLINKMAVTPGFDFSAYIERSRQLSTVANANSPLYDVKLDIHLVTSPDLQMRTAIARLSGDADLNLRGSVARPALLGRVDVLEGRATFHGTRFTLERGDITFTNPVAIEPQLNLQATTHVRNYDLNITLTGTPDRGLNLNYRSEPPLPKSDIIALLALGRTSGEAEQLQEQSGQSVFSDQASAQILNDALNSTVSSRVQRLFGASNIKIDPQGLTTETNPVSNGPQITIEQEFANNLSLTYSTNVSQSSQQIIQGEYYFNRDVSAVGTRDQNGVVSFDLRVRRRKK